MSKRKKQQPASISVVPVSPRTGKQLRSVRKGQIVQYAVKGKRGALKLVREEPQAFYKSDLAGLNKQIQNTKGGNFVVYEQITRKQAKKLVKGKWVPVFNKDGSKKKETKVTYAQPKRKQRPILYIKGKRKRELDIGFRTGNYQSVRTMRELTIVRPNVLKPVEFSLEGDTIKKALSGLYVNASVKDLMKRGKRLFYSLIIKITEPDGSILKIPVNDTEPVSGFEYPKLKSSMILPGEKGFQPAVMDKGGKNQQGKYQGLRLANLKTRMAKSIRMALKDFGYRFTSLAKLKQIESREQKRIDKMKKQDAPQHTIDRAEAAMDSLHTLGVHLDAKDLPKQITNKYKVQMYVRFEEM